MNRIKNKSKAVLQKYGKNSAKSFANLIGQISRDQTVRYLLTLIDDLLSLDKENIYLFHEYSVTMNQSAWAPFMNLLSRPDHFISHQGRQKHFPDSLESKIELSIYSILEYASRFTRI